MRNIIILKSNCKNYIYFLSFKCSRTKANTYIILRYNMSIMTYIVLAYEYLKQLNTKINAIMIIHFIYF